jgi:hypothetical protein
MRLALLIVVFHIFLRREGRLREDVVALCARVVDRAVGFDGEDVRFAVLYAVNPCKLGSCLAFNASRAYLLLILREGLVFLEELWDVGLVGYFEHGNSLDGHFGGGACGNIAINGVSEEFEECRVAHELCQGDDTKAWRHVCHILGLWFDGSSRPSLSLDRLDKSFGHQLPQDYRKSVPSSSWVRDGPIALYACIFNFESRWIMVVIDRSFDETRSC